MQLNTDEHIQVGRVVSEDDDFMLLEVVKNKERKLQLDPETPDRFFTFAFTKFEDNEPRFWVPWDE